MIELLYIVRDQALLDNAVQAVCKLAPNESQPMAVKIYKWDEKRTELQNNYLNGWVYRQLAKLLHDAGIVIPCDDGTEIPYTRDILHDWVFSDRFRVKSETIVKGKVKKLYESTAEMGKKRFGEYVDQIHEFAHQYWKVSIPPPNGEFKEYAKELELNQSRGSV